MVLNPGLRDLAERLEIDLNEAIAEFVREVDVGLRTAQFAKRSHAFTGSGTGGIVFCGSGGVPVTANGTWSPK